MPVLNKAVKPIVNTLIPPHPLHIFYLVARIKYSIVKQQKEQTQLPNQCSDCSAPTYISVMLFSEIGSGKSAPAESNLFFDAKIGAI